MGKIRIRCNHCNGSGRVLSTGMMQHDCEECDGTGKIYKYTDDIEELNIRHTESYKNAISKIVKEANVSEEKAKELLDKELDNEKEFNNEKEKRSKGKSQK